jgi:large subunit ribosomal protein L21
MYAIVRVGNKQYRVEKGDTLLVDRVRGDEGSKLDLEPLLYRSDETVFHGGDLEKVRVEAAVVGHERGKKIHGLKFKPKRGYKVRYGARADLTRIEIKDIKLTSRKPASSAQPKDEAAEDRPAAEKKAPAKKAAAKKAPAKKAAAKKAPAKKAPAKKAAAKKAAAKKEDQDGS